jgi:DNA polymerase-3 subunit alpha
VVPEWPTAVKLQEEKEALGFYLSGHPLERFATDLARLGSSSIDALQSRKDGDTVSVVGVITLLRLKNTKKGDRYATFMLEDMRSTIEVVVWPDTYREVGVVLSADDPVLVTARLDVSEERRLLIAQEIESLVALRQRTAKEAIVMLPAERADTQLMEQLRSAFSAHRGPCPVRLVVQANGHGETHVRLPAEISVEPSEALCNLVETIVGKPVLSFV